MGSRTAVLLRRCTCFLTATSRALMDAEGREPVVSARGGCCTRSWCLSCTSHCVRAVRALLSVQRLSWMLARWPLQWLESAADMSTWRVLPLQVMGLVYEAHWLGMCC